MFIEIHSEWRLFDSSWGRIFKYFHGYNYSNPLGLEALQLRCLVNSKRYLFWHSFRIG